VGLREKDSCKEEPADNPPKTKKVNRKKKVLGTEKGSRPSCYTPAKSKKYRSKKTEKGSEKWALAPGNISITGRGIPDSSNRMKLVV